jgi:hypothetical protein
MLQAFLSHFSRSAGEPVSTMIGSSPRMTIEFMGK